MKNTYQIDAAHSHVQFSVRHLMVSNVRGTFSGVTGTVSYDPDKPAETTIDATIDVNSVNTNDEKRDGHLKSADFFDAEKFPAFTFKTTNIDSKGGADYAVTGDLTLHGVTKPVTFAVEDVSEPSKDPWGNQRIGLSATGKINRKDFGLTWNATLEAGGVLVGEDVTISLEVQFIKA